MTPDFNKKTQADRTGQMLCPICEQPVTKIHACSELGEKIAEFILKRQRSWGS